MIKKIGLIVAIIVLIAALAYSCPALAKIGIGLGAHYNVALKDFDTPSFDKSHLSYVPSVRAKAAWFILDGSLDYRLNPGGDISFTLSPRISFLVDILGSGIYGGVGVQKTYIHWTSITPELSDLAYILQTGWEISLGALSLALDAQYESPVPSFQDIDPGFITFGARIFLYF